MSIGINLAKALAAARNGARELVASELANEHEPPEFWWYYPPSPAVQAESSRLQREHGLLLVLTATRQPSPHLVTTHWLLVETASGETMELEWTSAIFKDAQNATLAVLGTARHHERGVSLSLFRIPVVKNGGRRQPAAPPAADRVVDGVPVDIVPPRGTAADNPGMPAWAEPTPAPQEAEVDEAIADPGLLPGDEVDAEAEREQLAPDADAAARGEVREPIDMAALFRRMTAWRAEHGSRGNPRALAGASTSGPLTQDDAAAIDGFLAGEGF